MKITDTDHGYNVHIGVGASITTFPNNKHIPFLVTHTWLSTTMDTYSHVTKKMRDNTVDIFENILKDTNNKDDGK